MKYVLLGLLLGVITSGQILAAEPSDAGPPAVNVTAEDIAREIAGLDADRFADRELATEKLIAAGRPTIAPIMAKIKSSELEVTERMLQVLRELALAEDEATEDAAREALESLAIESNKPLGKRAQQTLRYLNELRQDRAVAAIRKLGGKVDEATSSQFVGGWMLVTTFSVEIDSEWKGGERGLRYLRWLPDLQVVTFRGPEVTDAWLASIAGLEKIGIVEINRAKITADGLKHLKTLPALQQIAVKYTPVSDEAVEHLKALPNTSMMMLYGTKITPEGISKLEEALAAANVKIDFRRGGFLGVGCHQLDEGCAISQVHPGSAAEKAGLREGDIVVKYNDKDVTDFQSLTSHIAQNIAGDTIKLQVRRGGEPVDVEVTLGEWE